MTNKLAKAVVPALSRIVSPVAVCQRDIVDVPLSCLAERTAGCDAGAQEPQHCPAQMPQTLEGADPSSRCCNVRSVEVVDQIRQLAAVGHV